MMNVETSKYQKICLDTPHQTKYLRQPDVVPWDPVNWPCLAALIGICYMVSLELLFKVIFLLRNLRGLYYWSLVLGSFGCIIHITGSLLRFLVPGIPWEPGSALIILGWWPMIVGQSLVLYSRLYLVVNSRTVIWAIRGMIAATFIAFLVPAPVSFFLDNADPSNYSIVEYFDVIEKTQLCGFLVSETALSITYIVATWRVLQLSAIVKVKRVVRLLIVTNVTIITLDAMILIMEFVGWYALQVTLKPTVYAIKLKLEFAFLNQLLFITKIGYSFIRDPRKPKKESTQLTNRSQIDRGWVSGNSDSRDDSKERTNKNQNTAFQAQEHQDTRDTPEALSKSKDVLCHSSVDSNNNITDLESPPIPFTGRYEDHISPSELCHPWERDDPYLSDSHGDDRDWESRPSVTTQIEAAANQDRSALSGLQRRNSNENLGAELDRRLRRAEIGLRDFA